MLDKYSELFKNDQGSKDTDKETEQTNVGSFDKHWGWFATLYNLAETGILSITGGTSITELNINFVLNYLAIQKDYNELERQAQKRAMQKNKNRIKLK